MTQETNGADSAAMQKKKIAVMEAVGQISKDKKNAQQNYEYLSDDAIASAVQAAMAKAGLALTMPKIDEFVETEVQTKSGGVLHCVRVRCVFGLADADNGATEEGVVYGFGMDSGDKAIYKAMTGARKYFFRLAFGIGTGNDAEADAPERGPGRQPARQSQASASTSTAQRPQQSGRPITSNNAAAIIAQEESALFAGMAVPPAAWLPLSAALSANNDGDDERAMAAARDMHDAGMRWSDGTRRLEDMANDGKKILKEKEGTK